MSEEFEQWKSQISFGDTCTKDYKEGCEDGAELAWIHQQVKVNNLTCELNKSNELHTQCASELWNCKEDLAALREALREAVDLRVALWRNSDFEEEYTGLTDVEIAKMDSFAKRWRLLTGDEE